MFDVTLLPLLHHILIFVLPCSLFCYCKSWSIYLMRAVTIIVFVCYHASDRKTLFKYYILHFNAVFLSFISIQDSLKGVRSTVCLAWLSCVSRTVVDTNLNILISELKYKVTCYLNMQSKINKQRMVKLYNLVNVKSSKWPLDNMK